MFHLQKKVHSERYRLSSNLLELGCTLMITVSQPWATLAVCGVCWLPCNQNDIVASL